MRWLMGSLLALAAFPALAQIQPGPSNSTGIVGRDSGTGLPCYIGTVSTCGIPGSGGTVFIIPMPYATTQTNSTVTTHLTFQTALAANANRHGCTVTNTSTDVEYVFFGANGSATTSNGLPVAAGGQITCFDGAALGNDNVAITSKVTDGATYVVTSR